MFSKPNAQNTSDLSFEGERDKEITMPLTFILTPLPVSASGKLKTQWAAPSGSGIQSMLAE